MSPPPTMSEPHWRWWPAAMRYPAALTSAAGPDAAAVLRRLQEPAASEVFTAHGLMAPVP